METRYKPRGFPQRLGSLRLPLFPQPRRRYYLRAINLGVGPFYSIKVGSFYVVKATLVPYLLLVGIPLLIRQFVQRLRSPPRPEE